MENSIGDKKKDSSIITPESEQEIISGVQFALDKGKKISELSPEQQESYERILEFQKKRALLMKTLYGFLALTFFGNGVFDSENTYEKPSEQGKNTVPDLSDKFDVIKEYNLPQIGFVDKKSFEDTELPEGIDKKDIDEISKVLAERAKELVNEVQQTGNSNHFFILGQCLDKLKEINPNFERFLFNKFGKYDAKAGRRLLSVEHCARYLNEFLRRENYYLIFDAELKFSNLYKIKKLEDVLIDGKKQAQLYELVDGVLDDETLMKEMSTAFVDSVFHDQLYVFPQAIKGIVSTHRVDDLDIDDMADKHIKSVSYHEAVHVFLFNKFPSLVSTTDVKYPITFQYKVTPDIVMPFNDNFHRGFFDELTATGAQLAIADDSKIMLGYIKSKYPLAVRILHLASVKFMQDCEIKERCVNKLTSTNPMSDSDDIREYVLKFGTKDFINKVGKEMYNIGMGLFHKISEKI
jgi:hypothetical protein